MKNKEMINKLKENAELAWASYGYYDLIGKKFKDKKDKYGNLLTITLHDIMDATYFDYETQDSTFFNTFKLKGDMTPTQAKRFFSRYDLLIHQPNTTSGFSATLFEDLGELEKELDNKTNTRKKLEKDRQYILAIRGTEFPLGELNNKTNARKSATLFQDKESKEYILAIRGTELKQGIFEDTQDNNQKIISIRGKLDNKTNARKKLEKDRQYILAIRGTEFPLGIFNDIAEADVSLALDSLPNHQYIDMLRNLL
ncbi:hypothetical protein [Helicobacter sp. MIT 14-3879]|uniref:hypothetical protein n=1 Tax=Helicobacter sp. MIT 14-3879 TaxID=2040649 RepID=UPI002161C24C|nr:hypothetical protein [Helicobacter sp. MIT 14-3879]